MSSGFEKEQHVGNLKHPPEVLMIDCFDWTFAVTFPVMFTGGNKSAKFGINLEWGVVDNLLLFSTVKEFSKPVNIWWSYCKNSTPRFLRHSIDGPLKRALMLPYRSAHATVSSVLKIQLALWDVVPVHCTRTMLSAFFSPSICVA